jgi:hypothetical protein
MGWGEFTTFDGSEEDEVVAVDDFGPAELAGADLDGIEAGDSAGELGSVRVTDADDLTAVEVAFAPDDARGQEALAAFAEGFAGAFVDKEGAFGVVEEGDPAFASSEFLGGGDEEGAFRFALEDAGQGVGVASVGDDEGDSGADDDTGGLEFGGHAADGGFAGGAAGKVVEAGVERLDDVEGAGVGFAEVLDHPVYGGEDDEEIGGEEAGDERGESVIIPELEFGNGDGVVFVDDGDHTVVEQGQQGISGIEMAFMVLQVVVDEEDLGDVELVAGEEGFVGGHEPGLTHGGAGLELSEVFGAAVIAESAHAGADGAGGDEDDFAACPALFGDLGHELFELMMVGLFAAVGQDAGAQFEHEAGDLLEQVAVHAGVLAEMGGSVEKRGGVLGSNSRLWFPYLT